MKLFGRRARKAKEEKENILRLRSLDGRVVTHVTERNVDDYGETTIGREGVININDSDELIIVCGNEIVFRHPLEGLTGGELMSLDGINLRYKDNTGQTQTVVAYYKYYR